MYNYVEFYLVSVYSSGSKRSLKVILFQAIINLTPDYFCSRIRLMHMLGEGAFGCVFYAELQPAANDDNKQVKAVAVKMLKCKFSSVIIS